jgi:small subunit ribosomal protein S13
VIFITVKRIVRLLATDLDGELNVGRALKKIKGIGFVFSRAICTISGIAPEKKIGTLSEEELKKLEDCIKNPAELPKWLLNRRKDWESGIDAHLVGSSLDLRKREDINLLKRIRSYRGIRHELGLPVRGQRTRSSFRTQKTVGVTKKTARMQATPKAEKKEEKK